MLDSSYVWLIMGAIWIFGLLFALIGLAVCKYRDTVYAIQWDTEASADRDWTWEP